MNLFEDKVSDRTITFEELENHFKSKYQIDIRDFHRGAGGDRHFDKWCKANGISRAEASGNQAIFTRYIEDPEGQAKAPEYFDFWHWLLKQTDDIPWTEKSGGRWKIAPLPTVEQAYKHAERAIEARARLLNMIKAVGADPRRVPLPSIGQEAVEVLKKIEEDFGKPISVLMSVSG